MNGAAVMAELVAGSAAVAHLGGKQIKSSDQDGDEGDELGRRRRRSAAGARRGQK